MNEKNPNSVSIIVTSPPYNLDIKYNQYNDGIPREEYLQWIDEWTRAVTRILAVDASLFLNVGASLKDPWISMDVARVVGQHLTLQNTFHWIKSISIDREHLARYIPDSNTISLGHYKPVNSKRFVNDCHEYVFHFTNQGDVLLDRKAIGVPFQDKSNIKRWKSAGVDLRCRGNNWFVPYDTIVSREKDRPHPATFPPRIVENCLKIHGIERIKMVMDPFMGIGTTALVCGKLGLPCTGYEIDSLYYSESIRRLEAQVIQSELKHDD